MELNTLNDIHYKLNSLVNNKQTVIIGIDGCGGSGKSTLANRLADAFTNVTIVHMDDFFLPSTQRVSLSPANKPFGADFDWQRLITQVLEPIRQNREGYYQRYDWEKDALAEWHVVPAFGMVMIEGVYSIRTELAKYYDLTIWVDCVRETRLARGLTRDGEAARDLWVNNWMISEDYYVAQDSPRQRADFIIKGDN